MSQILDFYKSVLTSISCDVDDEGYISTVSPTGAVKPLTVEGKRAVLPTKEWLRKGFGEDFVAFHPLCESMAKAGTSPILQFMQRSIKSTVAHYVVYMAQQLLEVSADRSTHKDIPPGSDDFLKKLVDADKSTVESLEKLISVAVKKNRLLTVYLKNGGHYDGKKVNRMAIIRFPILEDLQNAEKDVLGVTLTKKNRKVITALFKLIVPFGDSPEEYAFGTTVRVAPYLTALLTSYHKLATVLNQLVARYAEPLHLPLKSLELFDLDELENFGKLYNQIPVLKGNDGNMNEETPEASETTKVAKEAKVVQQHAPAATVPQPSRHPAATPAVQQPVKAEQQHGTVSMADFMAACNPAPQYVQQQPQMQPVQFNQQPVNMLGYPQVNQAPMMVNQFGQQIQQPQPMMMQPQQPQMPVFPWMQQQQQQNPFAQVNQNPFAQVGMQNNGGLGLV